MARYGLDLGTTTTVLTDYSTGKSLQIPIGAAPEFIIRSEIGGVKSAKRFLYRDTDNIIECFDEPDSKDVDSAIKVLFTEVIRAAKTKGHDLTQKNCVRLGCPAGWDWKARERLVSLALASKLGLDSMTLVEESVAAGIQWAQGQMLPDGASKVLVFDMGGGTLDMSVLEFHAKGGTVFETNVLASDGTNKAGDFFDCELAKHISKEIGTISAKDLLKNHSLAKAKEELTYNKAVSLTPISGGSKLSFRSLTADDIENVAKKSGFLSSLSNALEKLLRKAYLHQLASEVGATSSEQKPDRKIVEVTSRLASVLEKDGSEFATVLRQFPFGILGHVPNNEGEVNDALRWRSLSLVIEGVKHRNIKTLRNQVQHIVFVGGMSQIPLIQKHVGQEFEKATLHLGSKQLNRADLGSKANLAKDALDLLGAVAKGLNDEKSLDSLNLDRVKYNVILEVPGKGGIVVHRAFQSVYELEDIRSNHPHLHSVFPLTGTDLPTSGRGRLLFQSPNGEVIEVFGGKDKEIFYYEFGPYNNKEHSSYQPRIILNFSGDVDVYNGYGRHHRIAGFFRKREAIAIVSDPSYEPSEPASER
jgi:actin-like ATPase involved in cell morphogenesis